MSYPKPDGRQAMRPPTAWMARPNKIGIASAVLVLGALLLSPAVGAPGSGGHSLSSTQQGVGFSETELNLVTAHFVSRNLLYNGFFNVNDRHFPKLLTGANASEFWPLSQSVMLLAPHLKWGHDSGILLFPGIGSVSDRVSIVGVNSPELSGDGHEIYLFVTPLRTVNWQTPYYATDPEGSNGTFAGCQGSVIFPYSSTPYIVVQWDPAYTTAPCGYGSNGRDFNLYLVTPLADGTVGASEIALIQTGTFGGRSPKAYDFLDFKVTFHTHSGVLKAVVTARSQPATRFQLHANLIDLGFVPHYHHKIYFFGLGGSGNHPAGWGALFASFHSWQGHRAAGPAVLQHEARIPVFLGARCR